MEAIFKIVLTLIPVPGVNPAGPYSTSHDNVFPPYPEVQLRSAELCVIFEANKEDEEGQLTGGINSHASVNTPD